MPAAKDRKTVHDVIYDELCRGIVREESKARYLEIVNASATDGVILGCTEVGLLLTADDLTLPVFDTTQLHAQAALDFALDSVL